MTILYFINWCLTISLHIPEQNKLAFNFIKLLFENNIPAGARPVDVNSSLH